MARAQSKGKCIFCREEFSKNQMTRHLQICKKRGTEAGAGKGRKPKQGKLFHLVVEGRDLPGYWMHLEIPAEAALHDLDQFLRETWLECCGHLSAFMIEGEQYLVTGDLEPGDKDMKVKLSKVLRPGLKFFHDYDFGTTTHLALKVVSEREGEIPKDWVNLLAMNNPPLIPCEKCGKPATQVCVACGEGWLCEVCVPAHECEEDMFLPVVNSPRVGQCGYTGTGRTD
jgi:hypothetical protein